MEQGPGSLPVLECDYLVVGAGARGLAFVDAVLEESIHAKPEVSIVIVDRRNEPGGHWNDAYSFARLHRESTHYGVGSKKLERPREAKGGHFASAPEIVAYYLDVMDHFKESGCVQFFPRCAFRNGLVESLMVPGRSWMIPPKCKIVETAYARVQVPSTRPPPFEVGVGAVVVPPNALPSFMPPPSKYCVIGAGRTGIDVVLWLLSFGVPPGKVQWVMPRDHWYMCREALDGKRVARTAPDFGREGAKAKNLVSLLEGLERIGLVCRLCRYQKQECFHGAAVTREELAQLRRVKDIVRLGRVRAVRKELLVLDGGDVPVAAGTLHVDCTSSWIRDAEDPVPIWQRNRIVLQPVQEVFVGAGEFNVALSAGLVGTIEATVAAEDNVKNSICTAGKHPDTVQEWLRHQMAAFTNPKVWKYPRALRFLSQSRLSLLSALDVKEYKAFMSSGTNPPVGNLMRILHEDEEARAVETAERELAAAAAEEAAAAAAASARPAPCCADGPEKPSAPHTAPGCRPEAMYGLPGFGNGLCAQ